MWNEPDDIVIEWARKQDVFSDQVVYETVLGTSEVHPYIRTSTSELHLHPYIGGFTLKFENLSRFAAPRAAQRDEL